VKKARNNLLLHGFRIIIDIEFILQQTTIAANHPKMETHMKQVVRFTLIELLVSEW